MHFVCNYNTTYKIIISTNEPFLFLIPTLNGLQMFQICHHR